VLTEGFSRLFKVSWVSCKYIREKLRSTNILERVLREIRRIAKE
jgi:transposase-like protein